MNDPGSWASKHLAYDFSDAELLNRALTHKSYSAANNERLEFLGDSVLGYVIAETLYRQEASSDEGSLTRLRALLVRGETLAELGRDIGLGKVMRLGSGEQRAGDHQRDSILADGMEALFGAVLLDGGLEASRSVILHLYARRLEELPSPETLKDPKTRLQEALQAVGLRLPAYSLEQESGPPHARHFAVSCSIPGRDIRTDGQGASRRAAEQDAAAKALLLFGND